ncbi:hypothetical protein OV090_41140 [Nannocystis sp. RBIL2]|uniref:hypothetical protein n=1 Tax=Nannocystis sp. RBIL2 TaxID=2996788 RepID=UPI0022704619|nr:hypothetical protein [Nannocystis sp. RBIL2]MCY1071220.1 hypothetical protein [Nannocystis sp. RBIL2]
MADPKDTSEEIDRLLDGWGAPAPQPGFAERVLERADAGAPARPAERRWALARTFAVGGTVGGLLVGAAAMLRPEPPASASAAGRTHLQVPGVAEVVGEPGSHVQWRRRGDGRVVVEVVQGVVWVRRTAEGSALSVVADGEEVSLDGACGRVAVTRGFLKVDAAVDDVGCEQVEAAIAAARAELPRDRSR